MTNNVDPAVFARAVLTMVPVMLKALAARVITFLAGGATAGLFTTAIVQQTWIGLAIAATFALIVFLPVLLTDGRSKAPE